MREPDPSLEDRFLPVPAISAIPAFVAFILYFVANKPNMLLICGAWVICLLGSLYSQLSTGYAHSGLFVATWRRGSDYDAIYWLNVVITAVATCIFSWVTLDLLRAA